MLIVSRNIVPISNNSRPTFRQATLASLRFSAALAGPPYPPTPSTHTSLQPPTVSPHTLLYPHYLPIFSLATHQKATSTTADPPWRNWLARLTVIRITRLIAHQEVESSSLSGGDNMHSFFAFSYGWMDGWMDERLVRCSKPFF